jgi:acetylornithine deacetylase/succinyl-diaminopimelate desuccinylase-like protein
MMRLLRSSLIVRLLVVGVFAQSNQGTITGTISDPAGAVVPGAQIEVKNNDTGVAYRGGSSATANFVIRVPAGTYEIIVIGPGDMETAHRTGEFVRVGDLLECVACLRSAIERLCA